MLQLMQIDALAQRRIDQLSGGQQQRVALARALVVKSALLLMDEPLAALDAQLRTSIREDMHRLLHEVGITTIYVTHDQDEAMAIADRIVVMNRGVIAQQGLPTELYHKPQSYFVAHFIGQMNSVPVVVREGELELGLESRRVELKGVADGNYRLLFRPERVHFSLRPAPDDEHVSLPVILHNHLFLGHRTIAFVDFQQHNLRIEVDENFSGEEGQTMWLQLPLEALFIGEEECGQDDPPVWQPQFVVTQRVKDASLQPLENETGEGKSHKEGP